MAEPALSWRQARRRPGAAKQSASTPRRLRLLSTLIAICTVALTVVGVGALVVPT